jgi:hypothetical protein
MGEERLNSSRTWKSGEICRISGTYRCWNCHLAGREVKRLFEAGTIFPMCESCPEKDVTWRLENAASAVRASA